MNLLLDTHVFLWFVSDSRQLSESARTSLLDPQNQLMLSSVSVFEIGTKVAIGKLKRASTHIPLASWISDVSQQLGIQPLNLTTAHAAEVERLSLLHGDPFDRLLIAQARSEELVLVTADREISKYEVEVLW